LKSLLEQNSFHYFHRGENNENDYTTIMQWLCALHTNQDRYHHPAQKSAVVGEASVTRIVCVTKEKDLSTLARTRQSVRHFLYMDEKWCDVFCDPFCIPG